MLVGEVGEQVLAIAHHRHGVAEARHALELRRGRQPVALLQAADDDRIATRIGPRSPSCAARHRRTCAETPKSQFSFGRANSSISTPSLRAFGTLNTMRDEHVPAVVVACRSLMSVWNADDVERDAPIRRLHLRAELVVRVLLVVPVRLAAEDARSCGEHSGDVDADR